MKAGKHLLTVNGLVLMMSPLIGVYAQVKSPSLTAEQMLDAYQSSLSVMQKKVRFEAESVVTRNGRGDNLKRTTSKADVRRHNGKLEIIVDYTDTYKADGASPDAKRIRGISTHEVMFFISPKDQPASSLSVSGDTELYGSKLSGQILGGVALDGYIIGNKNISLPEMMRNGGTLRLREEMEEVDGHKTHVLEATGPYGKHVLWLDPEYGFNPRRITVQKSGNDLLDDRPISTPPVIRRGFERGAVRTTKIEEETVVDSIIIVQKGSVFFPTDANITVNTVYSDGSRSVSSTVHKRRNIDFNPDFDSMKAFVMDVPDGTPVNFQDSRNMTGIRYEWRNGEVVSAIDQQYLDLLDGEIGPLRKAMATGVLQEAEINDNSSRGVLVAERSDSLAGELVGNRDASTVVLGQKSNAVVATAVVSLLILATVGSILFFRTKGNR